MSRALRWALAAVTLLWATPASAQPTGCRDMDPLLSTGLRLRRSGLDAAALEVFRTLRAQCPRPQVIAQLALAEHALHRWRDAWVHLQDALAGTGDPWINSRRAALETVLGEIRPHLAGLMVRGDFPGAQVMVDGVAIGTLPMREPWRGVALSVEVDVWPVGGPSLHRTVALQEDRVTEETFVAAPAPAVVPPPVVVARPVEAPREERAWQRPVGWTAVAVGGALLVGGSVAWVLSAGQASAMSGATPLSAEPYGAWARFEADENYSRALTPGGVCDLAQQRGGSDASQVRDLCSSNATLTTLALGLGIGGAVVAVAGVVMVLTAPTSRVARSSARLSPGVAPGYAGASVAWSF